MAQRGDFPVHIIISVLESGFAICNLYLLGGLVVHLLTFPLQILDPVAITVPQNKCFNIWRNIVAVPTKDIHPWDDAISSPNYRTIQITNQIKDFSWLILKKYSENIGTAEDSLSAVPVIISAFYTAP
ncbi:hypothetical protein C8J57DRAFT_1231156 [Mycena rebaudengoi]|nr:hypothetical protein C8J57DRAFT_1231156 [Mycena rebaudengoi]